MDSSGGGFWVTAAQDDEERREGSASFSNPLPAPWASLRLAAETPTRGQVRHWFQGPWRQCPRPQGGARSPPSGHGAPAGET